MSSRRASTNRPRASTSSLDEVHAEPRRRPRPDPTRPRKHLPLDEEEDFDTYFPPFLPVVNARYLEESDDEKKDKPKKKSKTTVFSSSAPPSPSLKRKLSKKFQPPSKKARSNVTINLISSESDGEEIDPDESRSSDDGSILSHPSQLDASVVSEDVGGVLRYNERRRQEEEREERAQRLLSFPQTQQQPSSPFHSSQQAQHFTPPLSPNLISIDEDGEEDNTQPIVVAPNVPYQGTGRLPNGDIDPDALDLEPVKEDATRFRSRELAITVPQSGLVTPSAIRTRIEAHQFTDGTHIERYFIAAEFHQDGSPHLHGYIVFGGKRPQISFSVLDELMGVPQLPGKPGLYRRCNYQKVRSPAKWLAYISKTQDTPNVPHPYVCRRFVNTAWVDYDLEQWKLMVGAIPHRGGKLAPLVEHLYDHPSDFNGLLAIDRVTTGINFRRLLEANTFIENTKRFTTLLPWEPLPIPDANYVLGRSDANEHVRLVKTLNILIPSLLSGKAVEQGKNVICIAGASDCHKSSIFEFVAKFVPSVALMPNEAFPFNGLSPEAHPRVIGVHGFDPRSISWNAFETWVDSYTSVSYNHKGSSFRPNQRYFFIIDTNFTDPKKQFWAEEYEAQDLQGNLYKKQRDKLTPAQRDGLKRRLNVFKITTKMTFFPNPERMGKNDDDFLPALPAEPQEEEESVEVV